MSRSLNHLGGTLFAHHLDSCQRTMSYVRRTTSYNSDVTYDIVRFDVRCRTSTTSYVQTYDVDIRHRTYPTYDVACCDVRTISTKYTMSYVQITMSYAVHRMRCRMFLLPHRIRYRMRCCNDFIGPGAGVGVLMPEWSALHLRIQLASASAPTNLDSIATTLPSPSRPGHPPGP